MAAYPNLFIVGGEKAGTTSLFQYLRQHPEIHGPKKETWYFRRLANGEITEEDRETYLSLYEGDEAPYQMEASAGNLYDEAVPGLIQERSPEARILITLRDPVQRAYSRFWREVAASRETPDFTEAVQRDLDALDRGEDERFNYVSAGLYAGHVERYFETFGRDRVHVVLLDDIKADAEDTLADVFEFLDVDPSPAERIDTAERFNTFRGVPYGGWIESVRTSSAVKRIARTVLPKRMRDWLGNEVMLSTDGKPPAPEDAKRLLAEVFQDDVAKLEEILDRKLPELRASWPDKARVQAATSG